MAIGDIRAGATAFQTKIYTTGLQSAQNVLKIDPRFLDPRTLKTNDLGFSVNNWVRLSVEKNGTITRARISTSAVNDLIPDVFNSELKVLMFNVDVTISRTPNIITTDVKGLGGSVKQIFSSNDLRVTLKGTLSSPVSWQSDTYALEAIQKLSKKENLSQNDPVIHIESPELNTLYDFNRAVMVYFDISQDPRYSNLRYFTIELVSDIEYDLFVKRQKINKISAFGTTANTN